MIRLNNDLGFEPSLEFYGIMHLIEEPLANFTKEDNKVNQTISENCEN